MNLRAWPSVVVCEDRKERKKEREKEEGSPGMLGPELGPNGLQSRTPDIVGGGALCESLSITDEKDERIVPMNEPVVCVS